MDDLRSGEEEVKQDIAATLDAGDLDPPPGEAAAGSRVEEFGEAAEGGGEITLANPEASEQHPRDEAATGGGPGGVGGTAVEGGDIAVTNSETSELEKSSEPSTPSKSAKKRSKGDLKIKVVLLDGKSLDLEEGVCFCFYLLPMLLFVYPTTLSLVKCWPIPLFPISPTHSNPPQKQRKTTMESVVNPAHTETQTLETDFFSIYFYDDYMRKHQEQSHHLRQKARHKP